MAKQVVVRITCDKCQKDILDETDHILLKIVREDAPTAPLQLDLHEGCVDPTYLPDEVVARKRTRRTREQIEADNAAAAASKGKAPRHHAEAARAASA